jgi:hypothetical protein
MPDQKERHPEEVLRRFSQSGAPGAAASLPRSPNVHLLGEERSGLLVPVNEDVEEKRRAMESIGSQLFVTDAKEPDFAAVQHWIEGCGRQVVLPINFCGGLHIIRLYRLITPASEQTPEWMAAVHKAAAAYDFAFLALGHADDEADMTLVRDGRPTRFVTHPDTRAVDGINLLLSGVTAMQDILNRWPRHTAENEKNGASTGRHPLAMEAMEKLMHALREASFPILLDRAGLGHASEDTPTASGLRPIQIDAESLHRVEAFTRYRAHTYFMRATEFATLLARYTSIGSDLSGVLDRLFSLWGSMGAAADDLQDIFVDFAAGIHSICTVMAHLCVAEDPKLRPAFRRSLPQDLLLGQRERLAGLFGVGSLELDRAALVALLDEIDLRRALTDYFEGQGRLLSAVVYEAVSRFGFSVELIVEMVSVVCRDPKFALPKMYMTAFETIRDENMAGIMHVQVGKFITAYFLGRFWPTGGQA